jgi:hypothetical protein
VLLLESHQALPYTVYASVAVDRSTIPETVNSVPETPLLSYVGVYPVKRVYSTKMAACFT